MRCERCSDGASGAYATQLLTSKELGNGTTIAVCGSCFNADEDTHKYQVSMFPGKELAVERKLALQELREPLKIHNELLEQLGMTQRRDNYADFAPLS